MISSLTLIIFVLVLVTVELYDLTPDVSCGLFQSFRGQRGCLRWTVEVDGRCFGGYEVDEPAWRTTYPSSHHVATRKQTYQQYALERCFGDHESRRR
jgi:hypothetical protein